MADHRFGSFFIFLTINEASVFIVRTKILPLFLVAATLLAAVFFIKSTANRLPVHQAAVVSGRSSSTTTAKTEAPGRLARNILPPAAESPAVTANAEQNEALYIQQQIERLQELQAGDDEASLQAILAQLTNQNREVRHAAIEATIQFGGHSAVPILRNLAEFTQDAAEKRELLDAADFLDLPTVKEIREQNLNAQQSPQTSGS